MRWVTGRPLHVPTMAISKSSIRWVNKNYILKGLIMPMNNLQQIAIFKVGKHTSTSGETLNATADYLRSVVASYDKNNHQAPAVIGHPKDNSPAYGWVTAINFNEQEGILYADFEQVEPQFQQLLTDGRFKKRSASFYPPNHPSNPTKGKPYLRHVGFLGAMPPSVKGLKDFSDDSNCITFEFSEFSNTNFNPNEDNSMSKDKQDKANADDAQTADFAEQQAELAKQQKALADREKAIAEREAEFAKQQQEAKTAEFSEFTDGLIKTGQVVPAEKSAIVEVMMTLDGSDKTFDFAEGDTVKQKSSVEVLQGVLNRLAKTVDFSEHSASDPNSADKPEHGFNTDNDDELDKQIRDFAEANNLSYAEAAMTFEGA